MSSTPDSQTAPESESRPDPRHRVVVGILNLFAERLLGLQEVTLRATADEILAAVAPSIDDSMLRREALDAAVRSQRGPESGPDLVARAEALLAFLRSEQPSREAQEESAWKTSLR